MKKIIYFLLLSGCSTMELQSHAETITQERKIDQEMSYGYVSIIREESVKYDFKDGLKLYLDFPMHSGWYLIDFSSSQSYILSKELSDEGNDSSTFREVGLNNRAVKRADAENSIFKLKKFQYREISETELELHFKDKNLKGVLGSNFWSGICITILNSNCLLSANLTTEIHGERMYFSPTLNEKGVIYFRLRTLARSLKPILLELNSLSPDVVLNRDDLVAIKSQGSVSTNKQIFLERLFIEKKDNVLSPDQNSNSVLGVGAFSGHDIQISYPAIFIGYSDD